MLLLLVFSLFLSHSLNHHHFSALLHFSHCSKVEEAKEGAGGEQKKQLETLVKLLQPARIQSSQLNLFNLQLIAISAKAMGNCKLQLQLANKLALKTFSLGAMLTFYDQEKSHC